MPSGSGPSFLSHLESTKTWAHNMARGDTGDWSWTHSQGKSVRRARTSSLAFALLFPPHTALRVSGSFLVIGFRSDILRKAFWVMLPAVSACPDLEPFSWCPHSEFAFENSTPPVDSVPVKLSVQVPCLPWPKSEDHLSLDWDPWAECPQNRQLSGDIGRYGHAL